MAALLAQSHSRRGRPWGRQDDPGPHPWPRLWVSLAAAFDLRATHRLRASWESRSTTRALPTARLGRDPSSPTWSSPARSTARRRVPRAGSFRPWRRVNLTLDDTTFELSPALYGDGHPEPPRTPRDRPAPRDSVHLRPRLRRGGLDDSRENETKDAPAEVRRAIRKESALRASAIRS